MMITVVLSANMKRMLKDNIMVKKLVGIETAGSMNILFTDKTGTVTEGMSTVDRIVTPSAEYFNASALKQNKFVYDAFAKSAFGVEEIKANSTDKALRGFFSSENIEETKIISSVPFSSEKKYSSITLPDGKTLIKGAPEYIISMCSYIYDGNDKDRSISSKYLKNTSNTRPKAVE
jgi:magnesium-transporting ATPase (P-type)